MRKALFLMSAGLLITAAPALAWCPVREEVRPVVVAPVPIVQIGPVVVGVTPVRQPERVVVVERPRRHHHHKKVIIIRDDRDGCDHDYERPYAPPRAYY